MEWQKANFIDKELIYSFGDRVEVCKAYSRYHNCSVCLKTLAIESDEDINSVLQETLVQSSLDHPNVCKIYGCFITSESGRREAVVVMELMELDLLTAIQNRSRRNEQWAEHELLEFFTTLIDAFAFIQSKNIAHRDIKPNNILLSRDHVLKICDFGVSKRIFQRQLLFSVQGTRVFMSPQCKLSMQRNELELLHDPFKSDVYSLGMTLLSLARLVPPYELIKADENLKRKTYLLIGKLRYSQDIKSLLYQMLIPEEESRPDFLELQQRLKTSPHLNLVNTYTSQSICEADARKSLSFLVSRNVKVKVSLRVSCSNCETGELDLAEPRAGEIFCSCRNHCYCCLACYQAKEPSAALLSRPSCAPCTRDLSLSCLQCGNTIKRGSDAEKPIELLCNPLHVFCSVRCLIRMIENRSHQKFSSGEQVRCPRCDSSIDEDNIAFMLGRKEYFSMIKRQCMKCNSKRFHFIASCGHAFCKPCTRELKEKSSADEQCPCPVCNKLISRKEVRHALSMKKSLGNLLSFAIS